MNSESAADDIEIVFVDDEFEETDNKAGLSGHGSEESEETAEESKNKTEAGKDAADFEETVTDEISEKPADDADVEFIEITTDEGDSLENGGKKSTSKKGKKKKKWLIPVIIAAAIIVAAVIFGVVYYNYLFGGATYTKINEEELNVVEPEDVDKEAESIVNIALFGVDLGDDWTNYGRSDSIMIMSINKKAGTVKLISILRDTKAEIEGYEPQKINAAYQNGGPTLAIKTINSNFHLNIKDYVSVNFGELTQLIDSMDGVDIEITADEAAVINSSGIYDEDNNYAGPIGETVTEGYAHLNGAQALAFARIRKLDSDYYRADRQHKVLTALLTKVKEMKTSEYPKFIHELMNVSETSLDSSDILSLMSVASKKVTLESYTVPDPEFEANLFGGLDETGSWVWIYDLEKAAERIKSIIYGTPYEPDTSVDTSRWPSTATQNEETYNDYSGVDEYYDDYSDEQQETENTATESTQETATVEVIDPEPVTEATTETQPATEATTEPDSLSDDLETEG